MGPNDDLTRWGEPPASPEELTLAEYLAELLARDRAGQQLTGPELDGLRSAQRGKVLLEMCGWLEQMIQTVVERSGILEHLPPPADAGGPGVGAASDVTLNLLVSRQIGETYQPVARTRREPLRVRDMRRVPDETDRVTLQTGDRVRLEVQADRDGHVCVLNVGPAGAVNLLYPTAGESGRIRAGQCVRIADVMMTPPTGNERLHAIWTRDPAPATELLKLFAGGSTLRDMRRVQESVTREPEGQWAAVLVELEHRAPGLR